MARFTIINKLECERKIHTGLTTRDVKNPCTQFLIAKIFGGLEAVSSITSVHYPSPQRLKREVGINSFSDAEVK
jgi:hypothetical protein